MKSPLLDFVLCIDEEQADGRWQMSERTGAPIMAIYSTCGWGKIKCYPKILHELWHQLNLFFVETASGFMEDYQLYIVK